MAEIRGTVTCLSWLMTADANSLDRVGVQVSGKYANETFYDSLTESFDISHETEHGILHLFKRIMSEVVLQ